MTTNSTRWLDGEYDLESRGPFFPAHLARSQHSPSKHLQVWYYAVLISGMLFRRDLFSDVLYQYYSN